MEGFVKFWHAEKGYGFLKPTDGPGPDVFVHHSSIEGEGFKTLLEGAVVEYDVEPGYDGRLQAVRVRVVHGE